MAQIKKNPNVYVLFSIAHYPSGSCLIKTLGVFSSKFNACKSLLGFISTFKRQKNFRLTNQSVDSCDFTLKQYDNQIIYYSAFVTLADFNKLIDIV